MSTGRVKAGTVGVCPQPEEADVKQVKQNETSSSRLSVKRPLLREAVKQVKQR